MRLYSRQSDGTPITDAERAIGLNLLSKFRIERRSDKEDRELGRIIECCLDHPSNDGLARDLCQRVLEAVREYNVSAWDLNDLVDALTLTHPNAVLDILVEQASEEDEYGREFFRDLREFHPCPLRHLRDPDLITWADARPDLRYPALAKAIKFSNSSKEETQQEWSTTALALLENAPDPVQIVQIFYSRFHPGSFAGSYSAMLAKRIPLLEQLMDHANEDLSSWASEQLPEWQSNVDENRLIEESRARDRDESFE